MDTAAGLLRRARAHAGLTQAQTGEASGLAQSVISAYESGRREPSYAQVARIVAALGSELDLRPSTETSLDAVRRHRTALESALAPLGASNIRVFGSVARGDARPDSDVDLLVDINETVGLVALGRMETAAERILGRAVDIVPASALKPDVRESAMQDAVSL